jgi:hypothetical protein
LEQVAGSFDLPFSLIRAAVEYWAEFPDDVDAYMAHSREAEIQANERVQRVETLLG